MEVGAITDALKLLGYDGWMMGVKPVNPDFKIYGRAFTMQYGLLPSVEAVTSFNYYLLLNEIAQGDVIVLATNNCQMAILGENMQHASKMMKAAGVVLDGKNRDTGVIRSYDQPVFSSGQEVKFMPGNFKITSYQVPVVCGGIEVRPGDYIIGDIDGVIVIPIGIIDEVLFQAERITEIEEQMDKAIESGLPMSECVKIIGQKGKKREH